MNFIYEFSKYLNRCYLCNKYLSKTAYDIRCNQCIINFEKGEEFKLIFILNNSYWFSHYINNELYYLYGTEDAIEICKFDSNNNVKIIYTINEGLSLIPDIEIKSKSIIEKIVKNKALI